MDSVITFRYRVYKWRELDHIKMTIHQVSGKGKHK